MHLEVFAHWVEVPLSDVRGPPSRSVETAVKPET